jgi:hypothetical protein
MQPDRLQLQRFELKYVTSESLALSAREFVRAYLTLDENGVGKPELSYPVHSLYLDSEDLTLYQQTTNGNRNRYKLRIRFYDELPDSPVFLEIKRRADNAILKQRCPVRRTAVNRILQGQLPIASDLLSTDPKHLCALERFVQYVAELRAMPKAHVAYRREAWISPHDNSVRVTMDRDVQFDAQPDASFSTRLQRPVAVFNDKVVLEIKFTGRFPTWFAEFVRSFGLHQRSAAKYADGLELFGEERLRQPGFIPFLEKKIA